MNILLITLLTLLNAVFAMSELALTASRQARLTAMAQSGDAGAAAALKLLSNPTDFLSTVQVGITSIGILNGIVGDAAFSEDLAHGLHSLGMGHQSAAIAATALVVTLITLITIIFGELVPKRIGQLYPELVSCWVARPMMWLASTTKPFISLLSAITHGVLTLLRIDANATRSVTEEEIAASLQEGVGAGLIEQHEHQMVQNVFALDGRRLTSMMQPRSAIAWLDVSCSVAQAIEAASLTSHSWYPVCRAGLDDVLGVVSMARLLAQKVSLQDQIEPYVLPAVFVPETLSGMELLERLRAQSSRMVLVVDEYGVVQGLITPTDVLEAITGELQTEQTLDAWAVQRADGSWLVDGVMPITEFKIRLNIKELPGEDQNHYNTVAGLLQRVSGHLLQVGQAIECAGWRFEVLDLDGKRIDKVLVSQLKVVLV